jgi:DHHC palmitoyltransferase
VEIETNNLNTNKIYNENDKVLHNILNINNYNSSSKADKLDSSLHDLTEKYCVNCFIDIPIRGKHCKICGSCIATFDHHCSWVGNCIGENNRKYFLTFLLFHTILLSSALGIVM